MHGLRMNNSLYCHRVTIGDLHPTPVIMILLPYGGYIVNG